MVVHDTGPTTLAAKLTADTRTGHRIRLTHGIGEPPWKYQDKKE
jgi:hypothetical protein